MKYLNHAIEPTATACPRYVALIADDYLASDDSLDSLLEQLLADAAGDDVAVWDRYDNLAAVLLADGTVHRFSPQRSAPALTNRSEK